MNVILNESKNEFMKKPTKLLKISHRTGGQSTPHFHLGDKLSQKHKRAVLTKEPNVRDVQVEKKVRVFEERMEIFEKRKKKSADEMWTCK
jgi:hypothetical protein